MTELENTGLTQEQLALLRKIKRQRTKRSLPIRAPRQFRTSVVDQTLLFKVIDEAVERHGSLMAASRAFNLPESTLGKVRASHQFPNDRVLRALGLKQCISYVRRQP